MKTSHGTKFKEMKKMLKPLVEKKRRDRINQSLEQLRTLLLDSTKEERFQNPKLEKAEILELTVQYLEKKGFNNTKSKEFLLTEDPANPRQTENYEAGFRECFFQVTNFMRNVGPSTQVNFMESFQQYIASQNCTVTAMPHHEFYLPSQVNMVPCACSHEDNAAQEMLQHQLNIWKQTAVGLQFPNRDPSSSTQVGHCCPTLSLPSYTPQSSFPVSPSSKISMPSVHFSSPGHINSLPTACCMNMTPNQELTLPSGSSTSPVHSQAIWRPFP
uniref:BHLH domain-containing protein n=1 Tax=Erpetoichthys calabaricus TaxID=27687 RepID=A0A8C4S7A6_ERPCA